MDQANSYQLKRHCLEQGFVEAGAYWQPLLGGRSNLSWKVGDTNPIVVKLFQPENSSPLFDNNADLEWLCLTQLAESGIVPKPLHHGDLDGSKFLVLTYIHSAARDPNPKEVGEFLKALHSRKAPAGLPRRSENWIGDVGQQLGVQISGTSASEEVVFLHGDPVPSNLIATENGLVAIDWQCPAVGDPCDDIAIYLSPGMQSIYAGKPLSESEVEAFWIGYGNALIKQKFDTRKKDYSLVISEYLRCRGQPEDLQAAKLEQQR